MRSKISSFSSFFCFSFFSFLSCFFFHSFFPLLFFSFFFSFLWGSKSDFFWASISLRFLFTFHSKKKIFGPSRSGVKTPLRPLFLFVPSFSISFSFSWILFFFSFFFFSFFFVLLTKKRLFFICFSFLAFESEFNKRCFLRSRCSMEMWCLDDTGRDSWDWVGPPAWARACFNSSEWGGASSPVKTEPHQMVLLLLLFETHVNGARRQCKRVTTS